MNSWKYTWYKYLSWYICYTCYLDLVKSIEILPYIHSRNVHFWENQFPAKQTVNLIVNRKMYSTKVLKLIMQVNDNWTFQMSAKKAVFLLHRKKIQKWMLILFVNLKLKFCLMVLLVKMLHYTYKCSLLIFLREEYWAHNISMTVYDY